MNLKSIRDLFIFLNFHYVPKQHFSLSAISSIFPTQNHLNTMINFITMVLLTYVIQINYISYANAKL